MRIKMQVVVQRVIRIMLLFIACFIIWFAGNVCGIRYQQSKVKHLTGNGVAFLYELSSEQELTLDDLKEGQAVACILLIEKGSIDARIETESGEQVTSVMSYDRDGSYMFSVPSTGDYVIKITGENASVHVSTLMYDKAE